MATEISDWNDLNAIRNNLSGDYILVADLDENSAGYNTHASSSANGGAGWEPIGEERDVDEFTGTFDGGGRTIQGLYISRGTDGLGLFGHIGTGGNVQNLHLTEIYIQRTGSPNGAIVNLGGISGESWGGDISNCHVTGTITVDDGRIVGGIIGRLFAAIIEDCSFIGTIIAGRTTGGIVGRTDNLGSIVRRCFVKATIESTRTEVGGLVGVSATDGILRDSYSISDMSTSDTTTDEIGGVMGLLRNDSQIINCYSAGTVDRNEGGVLGKDNDPATTHLENSYWDTTVGPSNSALGEGRTTAQMQSISTYSPEWDIQDLNAYTNEIWAIKDGEEYPILRFEVRLLTNIKLSGAFRRKEIKVRISGTFVKAVQKVKVDGTWKNA